MKSSYYIDKLNSEIERIKIDIEIAKDFLEKDIVINYITTISGTSNITIDSSIDSLKNLMTNIKGVRRKLYTHNAQDETQEVPYNIHFSDQRCALWIYADEAIFHVKLDPFTLNHLDVKEGAWSKEYQAPERLGKWGMIKYQPVGVTYYPRKEFSLNEFLEEIEPLLWKG